MITEVKGQTCRKFHGCFSKFINGWESGPKIIKASQRAFEFLVQISGEHRPQSHKPWRLKGVYYRIWQFRSQLGALSVPNRIWRNQIQHEISGLISNSFVWVFGSQNQAENWASDIKTSATVSFSDGIQCGYLNDRFDLFVWPFCGCLSFKVGRSPSALPVTFERERWLFSLPCHPSVNLG